MWIMSSIREVKGFVGVMALLGALAGCSTQQKPVPDPVNQAPIVGDPALALRSDWPESHSYYQNGAVAAWSTRYPYDLTAQHSTYASIVLDPAMFLAQTILLPVEVVANPPFQSQVYYGVELPPSYTAQPPLPPRGGARVGPVVPFSYIGPQTPGATAGLPGVAPTAGMGRPTGGAPGESQLPAFPAPTVPTAAPPLPPPGAPGSILGPPATH